MARRKTKPPQRWRKEVRGRIHEPAAVSERPEATTAGVHATAVFSCEALNVYLADSEGGDNRLEEEVGDWMSDELSGSDGENLEDVPKW